MPGQPRVKWQAFGVSALLTLYLILALMSGTTREPSEDESWFATGTYNLAVKGSLSSDVMEDTGTWYEGMRRHVYWVPPLSFVANAVAVKIFGFSLLTIRGASAIWGLLSLVSIYLLVVKLSGSVRAGVAAIGLVAVDYFFLLGVSDGRMDAMCFALGITAVSVYFQLRERNFALAVLLSQSLVVASGLTHPNGILWFLGLLLITVWLDRGRLRLRILALALLPYLIGAVGWGAYVLEDPHNFWKQFGGNVQQAVSSNPNREHPLANPLRATVTEIQNRYLGPFGLSPGIAPVHHLKAIVLFLYVAAIIIALARSSFRKNQAIRIVLLLTAVAFFTLTYIAGDKQFFYLIQITPLMAITLALVLDHGLSQKGFWRLTVITVIVVLVGVQISGLLYRVRTNTYRNRYLPAVAAIKSCSRPGQLVMGSSAFFWSLHGERRLIDDFRLGFYTHNQPDVFVISPFYKLLEDRSEGQPELAAWIRQKRMEYHPLPAIGEYEIYCRPAEASGGG